MPSVHCRCRSLHFRGPLMSASLMHIWHTSNLSFSLDQSIPVDGSSPTYERTTEPACCHLTYWNVLADRACNMEMLFKCCAVQKLLKDCAFISMSRVFINQGEDVQQPWNTLWMTKYLLIAASACIMRCTSRLFLWWFAIFQNAEVTSESNLLDVWLSSYVHSSTISTLFEFWIQYCELCLMRFRSDRLPATYHSNLITQEAGEIKCWTWWVLHRKLICFQEEQSTGCMAVEDPAGEPNAGWQAVPIDYHHCTNTHKGKNWDPQIWSQHCVCA